MEMGCWLLGGEFEDSVFEERRERRPGPPELYRAKRCEPQVREPVCLTAATGPGGPGPTALQTPYARVACPLNPDPLAALRSPGPACRPSPTSHTGRARHPLPPRESPRSRLSRWLSAGLTAPRWLDSPALTSAASAAVQSGPPEIQPPPTFQISVLSALPTGLVLVHWVPLVHVNPAQVVKNVQLYPFLKVHLKFRLLQKVFSNSPFQPHYFCLWLLSPLLPINAVVSIS